VDSYAHLFIAEYDILVGEKKKEEERKIVLRPNLVDLKNLGT